MRKLFFKLFLISGIPFGLFSGILSLNKAEMPDVIINGALSGLVFGTITSFILIALHTLLSKKVVTERPARDLKILQSRRIELPLAYKQTYNLCLQSIKTISRCRIISHNINTGEIKARAGLNWKTWGDNINFRLTKERDFTVVEVSSRPSAGSTLVDFGKNLDNVERITKFLSEMR